MAKKKTSSQFGFESHLVLFRYFLGEIGVTELQTLGARLNNVESEGVDESGNTYFFRHIAHIAKIKGCAISQDLLREYDERICRYVRQIGAHRGGLYLKYFQYVALLFTEMYLDRYFSDREAFCNSLNDFIVSENQRTLYALNIEPYTEHTMNKLAYMCATGSGKTLIMHINILQYLFYMNRAKRLNSNIGINKIILLAPNEGMSRQHLEELTLSDINANIFNKSDGGVATQNSDVMIIDMNKLKEEGKVKTVSVDSFERNNLVLVDEAHRGMSSSDGVWYDYRTRLSEEGFAFEYSATFKQALNANSTKAADRRMWGEYGKSIIIDYSYKYFYGDGYGKDYRIYNLKSGVDVMHRHLYLVGCLMSFFQQVLFAKKRKAEIAPFNIENPLLIFVGNRVTATTSDAELSDVQEVLAFLDRFVRNKPESVKCINQVLREDSGLIDKHGRDLFTHDFLTLFELYGNDINAAEIFDAIMHEVFNSDSNSDEPRLHIEAIKQVQGEIAMKIGEYGDYFGVINIGDTAKLVKACSEMGIVAKSDEFISTSLFRSINDADSKVRILIGSRKFTEGWNSWRVSTMGLINFAKGEGSQAIQLFGRGVRLKGYGKRLKRSTRLDDGSINSPRGMQCVETLTIFGVKAQYMEDFKGFLEQEGAPTNDDIIEVRLPVVSRYDEVTGKKLHVIKVKDGANFKRQARRLLLDVPQDDFLRYLVRSKSVIDCRSKIQAIESTGSLKMNIQAVETRFPLPNEALDVIDYYRIFDELEQYKNEKAYYNISIDRNKLKPILRVEGWYELIIPKQQLRIDSMLRLEYATDYAIMALKSYLDKFYKFERERWEAPLLEYREMTADDNNFVEEYTFTVSPQNITDRTGDELESFISDIRTILNEHSGLNEYQKQFNYNKGLCLFDFRSHLYAPLISLSKGVTNIQISPVSLNDDEKLFVDRLKDYAEQNLTLLRDKSLYLLRNKSKVCMGFFVAGIFYPDYILWIDTAEKQYITFIDPKGLLRIMPNDPKVEFYKTIKSLQRQLEVTNTSSKEIVLNSFIMSATKAAELSQWWHWDKRTREEHNVYTLDDLLCVESMICKILSE